MYEKIFVPIDDSAAATKALKEAIGLAKACNSKLVLTHVVDLSQFGWGGTGFMQSKEVRDVTKEVGAKIMEHAKEVLGAEGFDNFEFQMLETPGGNVVKILADSVKSTGSDLVVMGTHGFSGVLNFLLGSVAEGVLKSVDVPVMFLRQNER